MITDKTKRRPEPVFTVTEPSGLLEFLLKNVTGKSRNNVKSLLTRKAVSVNGRTISRHDYALKPGQVVRIAPPEKEIQKQIKGLKFIYEDDELIVVDKPAGLLSIATDNEKEKTAYHLLTEYVRLQNKRDRIFVVHRLDRDTSGVLMAAKNEELKLALQERWNELVKTRVYTAVVEGILTEKKGTIRTWIKETKTHLMYSSGQPGDGLEAITDYEVLREARGYSLVNIILRTGRKNQIRVHMSELGHPVAGDDRYGAKTDPFGRLALHAGTLELTHPFTGALLSFESPIPGKFKAMFQM